MLLNLSIRSYLTFNSAEVGEPSSLHASVIYEAPVQALPPRSNSHKQLMEIKLFTGRFPN